MEQDIIGATGFSYEFNALDEQSTPLGDAFAKMHSSSVQLPSLLTLLLIFKFSWVFNWVPIKRVEGIKRALETMDAESAKILEQKKRDIADGGAGRGSGKDLVTLLSAWRGAISDQRGSSSDVSLQSVKANDGDAKTRMSDSELRAQIPVCCSSRALQMVLICERF